MAAYLILPTSGPRTYRGNYPTRVRSVSAGATGLHVELCNGTRLWAAPRMVPAALPKLKDDFAEILETAGTMTAEQYAELRAAAELVRGTRGGFDPEGNGRAAMDAILTALNGERS